MREVQARCLRGEAALGWSAGSLPLDFCSFPKSRLDPAVCKAGTSLPGQPVSGLGLHGSRRTHRASQEVGQSLEQRGHRENRAADQKTRTGRTPETRGGPWGYSR